MMKVATKLLLCIIICFLISACDTGLRVVSFEIKTYPDKIFYVAGVDKELILDGGTIQIINHDVRNSPLGIKHEYHILTILRLITNLTSSTGWSGSPTLKGR